jgi:hypothetical protein
MRPVGGFDRPAVQWIYVALGVVLIAVAAAEAVALRRARAQIESLHAADLNGRIEQERLQSRLAHEQATREALALELARVRAPTGSGQGASAPTYPTLTLTPLTKRGAQPPEATVARPPAEQAILLRLVLPDRRLTPSTRYGVVVRTWSGGETIWQRGGVGASIIDGKPMVAAFVTGDVFGTGAYEVLLTSMGEKPADVASYEIAVR